MCLFLLFYHFPMEDSSETIEQNTFIKDNHNLTIYFKEVNF